MNALQFAARISKPATVLATFLALIGCNVTPMDNPSNTASAPIAGLLEVRIEGIGDATSAVATFTAASGNSSVNTRALTALPDSVLKLVRREVSFHDVGNPGDSGAMRYIQASFELTNLRNTNFNNLNLIAINLPSNSIGGTAISGILNARGEAITNDTTAQAFMPTHGMQTTRSGLGVNPYSADLQFFTQTEANAVQTQAALLNPPLVGDVLQYGFVAHNNAGGRAIEGSSCSTPDCNKGLISLAYKFPLVSPRAANPWGFTAYFVVMDQTETFVSQSLEEQNQCTVLGQEQVSPLTTTLPKIRTLQGSSYRSTNLERLAGVRTAGTNAAPLASLPLPPAKLGGSLDQTCFAPGGIVTTAVGTGEDIAADLALTSDNKTVVTGYTNNGTQDLLLVARYNLNGSLDSNFGTAGKTTTAFNINNTNPRLPPILLNAHGVAVALQTDGKIIVAATVFNPTRTNSRAVLVRYNPDGSLDLGFGTAGEVFVGSVLTAGTPGNVMEQATALRLQTDGKIVLAGNNNLTGVLVRYTTTGALDTGFDTDGFIQFNFLLSALELQNDAKLVIGGTSTNTNFVVTRLLTDGTSDLAFRVVSIPALETKPVLKALVIQPDGKMILAGSLRSPSDSFLMRLNGRSLDSGFGNGGRVILPISGARDQINTLKFEPDGTLVAAGFNGITLVLTRYNSNGRLDQSFGTDGIVSTTIVTGASQTTGLGIRPDGKIVVATHTSNGRNDDLALLQYNP
jgi:uncharacterized delta-60 repeat protein